MDCIIVTLAIAMALAGGFLIIIYLTSGDHILTSLCPRVYWLLVKLAVAMVLIGGVQIKRYVTDQDNA